MFYAGDHLIIVLNLSNSKDVDITAVTINNMRYDSFLFPRDKNTLYIDLGDKVVSPYSLYLENLIMIFNDDLLTLINKRIGTLLGINSFLFEF
jgi:hypothetical protein